MPVVPCGGAAAASPVGGNGASAKCSRIFLIPPYCNAGLLLNGVRPGGTAVWLNEQVTRIEVRPKVAMKTYGHDKSCGAQDETAGIDSYDGTIQTRVQCCTVPLSIGAGNLAWIQVYPLGQTNGDPVEGYARITEDPIIMNLENGDPVEHNYTFVSKGQWNFPQGMIGFEGCCEACNCANGQVQGILDEPEPALLDSDPVTVYKWNGSGWAISYSEMPAGYVMGPAPDAATDKPKSELDTMRFVKCVKVAPTADLHSHPLATEVV